MLDFIIKENKAFLDSVKAGTPLIKPAQAITWLDSLKSKNVDTIYMLTNGSKYYKLIVGNSIKAITKDVFNDEFGDIKEIALAEEQLPIEETPTETLEPIKEPVKEKPAENIAKKEDEVKKPEPDCEKASVIVEEVEENEKEKERNVCAFPDKDNLKETIKEAIKEAIKELLIKL